MRTIKTNEVTENGSIAILQPQSLFVILDLTHYITIFSKVIYIFVVNVLVDSKITMEKF